MNSTPARFSSPHPSREKWQRRDKVPFGAAFGKGITMKMVQTNTHNYMAPLLKRFEEGQIDPSYIISHRVTLDEAPEMYKIWRDKKEKVTKNVIDPWKNRAAA